MDELCDKCNKTPYETTNCCFYPCSLYSAVMQNNLDAVIASIMQNFQLLYRDELMVARDIAVNRKHEQARQLVEKFIPYCRA